MSKNDGIVSCVTLTGAEYVTMLAEAQQLKKDNERLRAALEDIASGKYSGIVLLSMPPQDPAVNRARAALEGRT